MAVTWCEFVQAEVEKLTTENEFTRAIRTAAAFGNKEPETQLSAGTISFSEIDLASLD